MADAVCASEPECVLEGAVDAFGVVASGIEPVEVGVSGRDGAYVFRPVEFAPLVFVVAVQAYGDRAAAVVLGEFVVVVPTVAAALVAVAVRAHASQWREGEVAGVGEGADADGAVLCVEMQC